MSESILLVEDNADDVMFLKLSLQKSGVKNPIQTVADGREAMAYLSGEKQYANRDQYPLPYLMLLDLKLPFVMGLDILKWMRARVEFDTTVILVLTSSSDPADIKAAYHLKANGYVVKPAGMEKLHQLTRSIADFWLTHNTPIVRR